MKNLLIHWLFNKDLLAIYTVLLTGVRKGTKLETNCKKSFEASYKNITQNRLKELIKTAAMQKGLRTENLTRDFPNKGNVCHH
jgi:hypothetical protein